MENSLARFPPREMQMSQPEPFEIIEDENMNTDNMTRCEALSGLLLQAAYDEKVPIDRELAKGTAECVAYLLDCINRPWAHQTLPVLGEGGLWGSFARYAKRFAEHKGTVEVTMTLREIETIRDALKGVEKARNDALEEAAKRAEAEPYDENEHDVITVSRCIALGIRSLQHS